jgi:C-terminal processing protease CtpA/Prc
MKLKVIRKSVKVAFIAGLVLAIINTPQSKGLAAPIPTAAEVSVANREAKNKVLTTDGKTAYMQVPDAPSFHTLSNSMTLEAWCLASSFYPQRGSVNSILRKNPQAGAENFFLRIRNTTGLRLVELGLGATLGVVQAPADLTTNQWFHLAGTYDGKTVTLYLNGALLKSEARSGHVVIDNSDLYLGKGDPEFSFGEYFHGMLDEIRIWSVARSQADIQATLNKSLTGKEHGLVAYWNFDDGTANDTSAQVGPGRLEGQARIEPATRPTSLPAKNQSGGAPSAAAQGLTPAKRFEVLEALWQNLNEIYPALEYKGIRGRDWIEPALDRVRETKSDQDYYDLMLEQMARLKDTHTRILSYPGQPRLESPPVILNQVESKVAVIRAHATTSLKAGDVIVSIEGRPVEECLAEHLKRVCNSTERGRVSEGCGRLLRRPPGTTLKVRVEGADGTVRTLDLRCEAKPDFWREPTFSASFTGDSIGYIRISRWTDNSIPDQFDQALEKFKAAQGLVIDVRGNTGGKDQLADVVNGRLITNAVVSSIDFWRKPGTDQYTRTIGWVQPRGPWTYQGRVAVLIDEASMSACEHFVSGIEAMERVLLVGLPTNGAGGGPTVVELPDGTRVAISRALGLRANGVVFEGHGIPPHIYAAPTLNSLRAGRDSALDAAKAWILSGKPLPSRT